jgi:AmmeMemoRadiSam system protein B
MRIVTARQAAVAGSFYPGDSESLRATVTRLLGDAATTDAATPRALIAPHAGYVYSGPIAASAYHLLEKQAARFRRVVLIGPAHRVHLSGMAFPSVDAFETPLGEVHLDRDAIEQALTLPATGLSDDAHAFEHCLEVQLPFLQTVLEDFRLVPIVVGDCPAEHVARVLEALWDDGTLIVVSSDLSHYHPYEQARQLDARTTSKILVRDDALTGEEACGARAINGLMRIAQQHDLSVTSLDVRNSGDTAGDRSQVVGYGAYVLH